MKTDILVVGAGYAGSVVAERLASAGKRVVALEKRPHVAGNVYDEYDEHGVLIHRYGPHIFHTNSGRIVDYLSNFAEWRPYEHRALASVDGKLLPIPINLDTVNGLYGLNLREKDMEAYLEGVREPRSPVLTSEDLVVNAVGRDLYESSLRATPASTGASNPHSSARGWPPASPCARTATTVTGRTSFRACPLTVTRKCSRRCWITPT